MGNIKIIKGVFDTKLGLEHAGILPRSMRHSDVSVWVLLSTGCI